MDISIHAPHEGERPGTAGAADSRQKFQSTLPTRGSDGIRSARARVPSYFNPRSPRGGATNPPPTYTVTVTISIHAPHEGERPFGLQIHGGLTKISIHAPHEGERRFTSSHPGQSGLFQSTLPTRGSDPNGQGLRRSDNAFQSTLPTRGSDAVVV